MTNKAESVLVLVIGVISIVAFGYFTNAPAAVALFVALWTNNMSQ
jgi:hypothetical protein